MVQCLKVLSIQEKKEFIEYLATKNVPESKNNAKDLWVFKRTSQNFEIRADTLFYNKGGVLREVLCPEENEKLQTILTDSHGKSHRGKFFFTILTFKV